MRKVRAGQVSMEFVIIMAAMLLVLTLLIVIFNGIYSQQALRSQYLQAHQGLADLQASASEVWAEGNGSSQLVLITLPASTNLTGSNFTARSMFIYVSGFGHVSTATSFPINGTWPTQVGQTLMSVYNNGTTVLIRPAGRLEANLTGFYFSIFSGNSQQYSLSLRNRANVSYTVTHTLTCPSGVTCTYNATSPNTMAPEAQQVANLNVTSTTAGLSTGYLTLDIVPAGGSGLPTEQYVLPITVRVT
ncbi:MAG: hypothetical protein KGH63_02940 [Candidatus Micrarchaeota archaeon]|nr:hypothetical protein [Candidatus Micrarchaeota archaeon]